MVPESRDPDRALLQDVDLLSRLSDYFDSIGQHLKAGHGWLIFNAAGPRANRLATFMISRLSEVAPLISYYFVPWREFSLNAYMIEIELQTVKTPDDLEGKAKKEFEIATRVSRESMVKMAASDLLIVTGLRPHHGHELSFLEHAIDRRYRDRRPTILITPWLPHELAQEVREIAGDTRFWDSFFSRMYERNLIAV